MQDGGKRKEANEHHIIAFHHNLKILKINQYIVSLAPVYIWTTFVLELSLLKQLMFYSLIIKYSIYLDYWPMFTSVAFHTLEASKIFTAL